MNQDRSERIMRNAVARAQLIGLASIAGAFLGHFAPAFRAFTPRDPFDKRERIPAPRAAADESSIIATLRHARAGRHWRLKADRSHGTRMEQYLMARA